MSEISLEDFQKLDLRAGTIISAQRNEKARLPALVLEIDFGQKIGTRQSSAQLTQNHSQADLMGQQVICVMNLPPKRVAGVKSEVLVLALLCPDRGTVLFHPDGPVKNGSVVS